MVFPAKPLRIAAVVAGVVSGVLYLLSWGIGVKFWVVVGLLLLVAGLVSAFFIARRDYIAGATPAALGGILAVFIQVPSGLLLVAAILLFVASGLGFVLYEVD